MKRVYVLAGLVLAAQTTAHAATFNPFRGSVDAETATTQTRKPPVPKAKGESPTLPALPPAASSPAPMPLPAPRAERVDVPRVPGEAKAAPERMTWRVVGRMGDQITIINQFGDKSVVSDGSMKSGCMVAYPDVLCEKADIADAKKRYAAEARAREEEEATTSSLKQKVAEMEGTIAKMKRQMNTAYEETASFRASNAAMAEEKKHWGEFPKLVEELRVQLEATTRENERLKTENTLLTSRTQTELAKVRASMTAAPEWVKGVPKEYNDPSLGTFTIRRQAGEVFFTVANRQETAADAMFGKNVIRKERRGEYTYYALNAKSVRFKE